ncbi:A disintegrin and metalloproteinase with thrombospondin motifs 10-like isoform X2 [Venturia canescens]|nr:A disintegrin and metalloproteinase with thrombospondin motifs 10-like isoform X2 [Venturia canescens]
MQKRSINSSNKFGGGGHMRIRAFDKDINMWLDPRDSLFASVDTPVYLAYRNYSMTGNVAYVLQDGMMTKVGQLYENPEHLASLVIRSDGKTNETIVTGNIVSRENNATIVIKPLPSSIVEKRLRKRRSIDGNDDSSDFDSKRHVALMIKDYFPNDYINEGHEKIDIQGDSIRKLRSIDDSEMVDYTGSIYPKIFLQFDNTYTKHIRFSSLDSKEESKLLSLLEYVLAFWNGVDLSYRHLENPGIRIHIAGIAIATDLWATPPIQKNHLGFSFDQDDALDDATTFFYAIDNQIPYRTYDVAIIMTKLRFRYFGLGTSLFSGACKVNTTASTKDGVALVLDNGAFRGIDIAVHELAHTLGLHHDNATTDPDCDDYIMRASPNPTRNSATFSRCSLARFNEILGNGSLSCMYDPPTQRNSNLPKVMPGKMKTLDEQCQAYGYAGACPTSTDDICVRLNCISKTLNNSQGKTVKGVCYPLEHGAAPGTPCGNGTNEKPRFCLQKQCVSLD